MHQRVGPDVAAGGGRLRRRHRAGRRARRGAVARRHVGGSARPRRGAGRAPGRCRAGAPPPRCDGRSTCPAGDWALRCAPPGSSPRYLETDASWCAARRRAGCRRWPTAAPSAASPTTVVGAVAAASSPTSTADPVRALLSREDVVRLGPKRPPIAAGVRADGIGRRAASPARQGIAAAIRASRPASHVEEVDVAGPPTSASPAGRRLGRGGRGAPCRASSGRDRGHGAERRAGATPRSTDDGVRVRVRVRRAARRGRAPLVLHRRRAHGARLGAFEGIAVDETGEPHDLTIRSFGILRRRRHAAGRRRDRAAVTAPPVNGSDAVFAAVAAAAWRREGCPPDWPTHRRVGAS